MSKKKAVIIGAGPAGLTAAYELLEKTDIIPIVFEQDSIVGGLSRTVDYKGNKIDIGGHRFFSRNDEVVKWWLSILPLENEECSANTTDDVMLIRNRSSKIFFLHTLFDYPLALTVASLKKLGMFRTLKIGLSYFYSKFFPSKKETTLEEFFINRFGKELYCLFFKEYTEKVWGVSCAEIKAEWGAQRIKGLSFRKVFLDALSPNKKENTANTETSLIKQFMYPKLGVGQLWEKVQERIIQKGGKVCTDHKIVQLFAKNKTVYALEVLNIITGNKEIVETDFVLSSMAVKDLISSLNTENIPFSVVSIAQGLQYREMVVVGMLLKKKQLSSSYVLNTHPSYTWIYVQDRDVKMCRIQVFNNWSPYMVKDQDAVWVGLEYICSEKDEIWGQEDMDVISFAKKELEQMKMIQDKSMIDACVIRTKKAYPAYFGTYDYFDEVRDYCNTFDNLFLIGRNGMHRYNNQDHSMLSAIAAVDNIANSRVSKKNIWDVNVEKQYYEVR